MFTYRNRFRTVVIALIVVAVVCASPWIGTAAAQAEGSAEVEKVQNDHREFRRYELKHNTPNDVAKIIGKLLVNYGTDLFRSKNDTGIKMAVDQRTNALLVYAEQKTHEKIEALVKELDVPATANELQLAGGGGRVRGPAIPVELRIIWLATGLPPDQSKDLPTELKPVADALAKKDIEDLRLVGQVMVNTQSESQFSTSASPTLGGSMVEFNVNGQVIRRPEALSVFIDLTATKEVGANHRKLRLANLNTTIRAKPGEYMVLGLAPVSGTTSVFVVQANLVE